MKLPEREALTAAVRGMRDDCCRNCTCEEKPDFHDADCVSFVPVRLRIDDDDWNLERADADDVSDDEAIISESTIGLDDDDNLIEQVVDQLLAEVIELAPDYDPWEDVAELAEWG